MALLGAAQRAAGEHADDDDAHVGGLQRGRADCRNPAPDSPPARPRRARVQQIVADLRGVEDAGIDDPVQRGGLADRGDAEKAAFALLAQPLEGRHDLVEHDVGGEIRAAASVSTIAL